MWTPPAAPVNAWARVHPQPTASDGGIDFEYQVRREGPILLSADRPLTLVSSLSEGQP